MLSPIRWWAAFGDPLRVAASVATTKISDRDGSMTGVPVIPTVGMMLPQMPGTEALDEGGAHVTGPQHLARVGRQGVDGVVLGGGEDPTPEHQGLTVELAVEVG